MESNDPAFGDEEGGHAQHDLRQQISGVLLERVDAITADTVAIFPFSGAETLDAEFCNRVGHLLVELLAVAVRDGRLEPRGGVVADLHRIVLERGLSMERLFTFAYLTERTVLDELAVDETFGATSEPWPLVAQLVRARVVRPARRLHRARPARAERHRDHRSPDDALHAADVSSRAREGAGARGPVRLRRLADSVRRRSAVGDQQGARLRRRRQDSRAPRDHAADLFPAA